MEQLLSPANLHLAGYLELVISGPSVSLPQPSDERRDSEERAHLHPCETYAWRHLRL